MRRKWIWALRGSSAPPPTAATCWQRRSPGFSGTTLAKATFGDLDIKAATRSQPSLEGRAQDEGGFRPLRPAEHVGPLHAGPCGPCPTEPGKRAFPAPAGTPIPARAS